MSADPTLFLRELGSTRDQSASRRDDTDMDGGDADGERESAPRGAQRAVEQTPEPAPDPDPQPSR